MRRTIVIAVREFQAAVHTKTFIISLLIMPFMGSAGLLLGLLLKDHVNVQDKRFAVIDGTGVLFDELAEAARSYNRTVTADAEGTAGGQVKPRFVLEPVMLTGDIDSVRADLSDRVRSGELAGFVEIDDRVLEPRSKAEDGGRRTEDLPSHPTSDLCPSLVVYYSNNPMYVDFLAWFQHHLNGAVRQWRVEAAGLPDEAVAWATRRIDVDEAPLYIRSSLGQVRPGRKHDQYVSIAAGVGLSLLMFLVILVGAIPLTYSVLEEKMQRSAEVLLGSVTPFQFMMGKILGMVGVSLSIVTIYIVIGFVVAGVYGYGHTIPNHLINWFLLFQAGSILMYGSLYAAIGAACNDMKDAQNLMAPASLIACIPLFVIRPVMQDPNSTFSTLVSFFPPATPMVMLMRLGLPAPVPLWQPVLGLVLVVLTAVVCVALAARVFRAGILMQGKGADLKAMLQWAFYGIGHRPPRPERRRTTA